MSTPPFLVASWSTIMHFTYASDKMVSDLEHVF